MKNIIRVFIFYYDFFILKNLIFKLKKISYDNKIIFSGPVFLPTKIEKFDILRSPHVNKDSRDKLQISIYKRIMDFFNITSNFILLLRDCFFFYSFDFNFKFLYFK